MSSITRLDVDRLPQEDATFEGWFNLNGLVHRVLSPEAVNDFWVPTGIVRSTESLGFAAVKPELAPRYGEQKVWDDPYTFVWFVYHWGPQGRRYVANAVRKLRGLLPLIPQGRRNTMKLPYDQIVHPVITNTQGEDGTDSDFRWATFAKGGAVAVELGDQIYPGAVSCFAEEEDPCPAYAALSAVAAEVCKFSHKSY